MDFKKHNPDFKYIIRNSKQDIQILIKQMSELHHTPYRELPIENLGALSPLKTRNKPERETSNDTENTEDNLKQLRKRCGKITSQNLKFSRKLLTSLMDSPPQKTKYCGKI